MSSNLGMETSKPVVDPKTVRRGRLTLIALVVFFALPFIIAKAILSNNWYESGVTNHGQLIEPRMTFETLGLDNPLQSQSWQLGFMLPATCEEACIDRKSVV